MEDAYDIAAKLLKVKTENIQRTIKRFAISGDESVSIDSSNASAKDNERMQALDKAAFRATLPHCVWMPNMYLQSTTTGDVKRVSSCIPGKYNESTDNDEYCGVYINRDGQMYCDVDSRKLIEASRLSYEITKLLQKFDYFPMPIATHVLELIVVIRNSYADWFKGVNILNTSNDNTYPHIFRSNEGNDTPLQDVYAPIGQGETNKRENDKRIDNTTNQGKLYRYNAMTEIKASEFNFEPIPRKPFVFEYLHIQRLSSNFEVTFPIEWLYGVTNGVRLFNENIHTVYKIGGKMSFASEVDAFHAVVLFNYIYYDDRNDIVDSLVYNGGIIDAGDADTETSERKIIFKNVSKEFTKIHDGVTYSECMEYIGNIFSANNAFVFDKNAGGALFSLNTKNMDAILHHSLVCYFVLTLIKLYEFEKSINIRDENMSDPERVDYVGDNAGFKHYAEQFSKALNNVEANVVAADAEMVENEPAKMGESTTTDNRPMVNAETVKWSNYLLLQNGVFYIAIDRATYSKYSTILQPKTVQEVGDKLILNWENHNETIAVVVSLHDVTSNIKTKMLAYTKSYHYNIHVIYIDFGETLDATEKNDIVISFNINVVTVNIGICSVATIADQGKHNGHIRITLHQSIEGQGVMKLYDVIASYFVYYASWYQTKKMAAVEQTEEYEDS